MNRQTKNLLLRALLGVLILANMGMIFLFSSDNGTASSEKSGAVVEQIAQITVSGFSQKNEEEQKEIVRRMQFPIRKLAHFSEFASLGALCFLFLSTWNTRLPIRFAASVAFSFLYACSDEIHQKFSDGRAARFSDVLIDTSGAMFSCLLLFCIFFAVRARQPKIMKGTEDV